MPMAGMSEGADLLRIRDRSANSCYLAIIQETPPVCQAVRQAGVSIFLCIFDNKIIQKPTSLYKNRQGAGFWDASQRPPAKTRKPLILLDFLEVDGGTRPASEVRPWGAS